MSTPKIGETYACQECGLTVEVTGRPCEDTGRTCLTCCGAPMKKAEDE